MSADHLTTLPLGLTDVLANPHLRGDGEETPVAGHASELVSAAPVKFKS